MIAALRRRSFALYLAGNAASIIGTWAQRVVLFWLAWELSHSTAVIGLMAAADLLPSVVAAPFAGTLADRSDRLGLARRLQVLSIAPPIILLGLLASGQITIPALLAMSLATGVINGFDHPARMVLVGSLVEKPSVPAAVSLNSIVFNLARMVGPALGGAAISVGSVWVIFAANAVSYLGFAMILARVRLVEGRNASRTTADSNGWRQLLGGLDPHHRISLVYFALIAIFFRPVFELLPAFADAIARPGEDAGRIFGWMTSAQALGAMIGALAVSLLISATGPRHLILVSGTGSVLALGLFLLTSGTGPALVTLALLSGAILANGVSTQVMLQTEVADAMRGKVLSLYTMIFRGMPALGAFLIGLLATAVPTEALFWATIPVMLIVSMITAMRL